MFRNVLKKQLSKLTTNRVLRVIVVGAVLGGLLFQGLSNASAAQVGLTFSHSGDKYIYSNYPESINSSTGDHFAIEETLYSNTKYDIELYQANSVVGVSKRIGVAIYNPSSLYGTTITVYASLTGQSPTDQLSEVNMTTVLQQGYQLAKEAGSTTSHYIGPNDYWIFMSRDAGYGFLVNEKAEISSSLGGVKVRVFHGSVGVTGATVFGYTRDVHTYDAIHGHETTGVFPHDALTVASPALDAPTSPSFMLSQWNYPAFPANTNEYEAGTGSDPLRDSTYFWPANGPYVGGNYGMVYTVTVNSPGGRRIRITPNWTSDVNPADGVSDNANARIALWTLANGWYTTTPLSRPAYIGATPTSWLMGTGTGATFTFKYILPGGNFGNFKFEIID